MRSVSICINLQSKRPSGYIISRPHWERNGQRLQLRFRQGAWWLPRLFVTPAPITISTENLRGLITDESEPAFAIAISIQFQVQQGWTPGGKGGPHDLHSCLFLSSYPSYCHTTISRKRNLGLNTRFFLGQVVIRHQKYNLTRPRIPHNKQSPKFVRTKQKPKIIPSSQ